MINPYAVIAGIVAVGGAFGLGVKVGAEFEKGACDGRLLTEAQVATQVINKKEGELAQCRAQVDKINLTVAEQSDKIQTLLRADQRARQAAQQEARQRDVELAEAQARVQAALSRLKDTIDETDFGECAGAIVPDNLNSLLNDALAAGGDLP